MRLFKKAVQWLLTGAAIVICFQMTATVWAAGIEISCQSVGDEIKFAVSVNAQNSVKAFRVDISYDPDLMQYKSFDKTNTLTENYTYVNVNEISPGQLRIGGVDGSGNAIQSGTSGVMLQLTFDKKTEGIYELNLLNLLDDIQGWTTLNGSIDSWEPNDQYSQSKIIDRMQHHNFHDTGDEDWVWFYGVSGQSYTVQALNLGIRADVILELYDKDGTTLLTSQNSGGTSVGESIVWTCPQNGIYYAMAKHANPAVFGDDTFYDFQIIFPLYDAYENDDTAEGARVININGEPQRHTFRDTNDADWLKFYGLVNVAYTIQALNVGSDCDVILELYESNQKTMIITQNGGGTGQNETINWTCSAEDVYYIKATYNDSVSRSQRSNSNARAYDVQIKSTPPVVAGDITG